MKPISTTSSHYTWHVLATAWTRHLWLLLLVIAAPCAISAIQADYRWLILALMLLVIIYPFALGYFFFWHCLKPEVRYSIMPKYVDIDTTVLNLHFCDSDGIVTHNKAIPLTEFSHIQITGVDVIFTFTSSKYLFLILPIEDIPPHTLNTIQALEAAQYADEQ